MAAVTAVDRFAWIAIRIMRLVRCVIVGGDISLCCHDRSVIMTVIRHAEVNMLGAMSRIIPARMRPCQNEHKTKKYPGQALCAANTSIPGQPSSHPSSLEPQT